MSIEATDQPETKTTPDDPLGLSAVRDDYWLTSDDNSAYYGLLHQAQELPADELARLAKAFVAHRRSESGMPTFIDMIRNPQAFRGQPIQLKGHVLQTLEYEAEENSYGIEQLYESTLFTEDSQSHPTTIVFLEKPDNLPISGELVDGVTVNGYFLKNYWYPSSDNATRKAPLILAQTVVVKPPQPAPVPGATSKILYWGLGSAILILTAIVVMVQRSDRKRTLADQKKRLAEANPQFDQLTEQ